MKWILRSVVGLILLLVLTGGTFKVFQGRIGASVFERMAGRLVGLDQTATLEDGLHVYFCGTGSPLPDPERAGPCLGVLAGDKALVFDTGSGSLRKLMRMGFPVGETDRVFLTHLHSDHIDGLGEMMLQAWIAGSRTTPVQISGPEGTGVVANGFMSAYRTDAGYRTAHHGIALANPSGFGAEVTEISLPSDGAVTVFSEGGVRVQAFLVNHEPVEPAFGYRIDYKGRAVTISGDTVRSAAVTEVAKGSDLLIHEALNREMVAVMSAAAARNGDAELSRIFSDILDYHASPSEAAETAQAADVEALVLTHIVPPLPMPMLYPAFLDGAGDKFDGKMEIGEDGLMISLPAESDRIVRRNLLN